MQFILGIGATAGIGFMYHQYKVQQNKKAVEARDYALISQIVNDPDKGNLEWRNDIDMLNKRKRLDFKNSRCPFHKKFGSPDLW